MTVQCPSCSKDVSDKAFDCPHCGHPLRKAKRGFFGKIFKYVFIAFNILMLVWIVGGYNAATDGISDLTSEAERAGAAIGTGLGISMLLVLWVIGDIILGAFVLFTRPSK